MKHKINKDLFLKFVEGKSSPEEEDLVQQWLLAGENDQISRGWMEEHWNSLPAEPLGADQMEKIKAGMVMRGYPQRRVLRFPAQQFVKSVYRIAAVLIVVALVLGGIFYYTSQQDTNRLTTAWVVIENRPSSDVRVKPVTLPDGTKVWLNAGSTLRYPSPFVGEMRDVQLTGEAFFDVAEDAARPFIVHTSDLDVKVLGTAFNVKSYPGDGTTEAVLVRGSVQVEKLSFLKKERVKMIPNERIVYSRETSELSKTAVDPNHFIGWKDGTLRFDNEPMSSVIPVLERWYSIKISTNDNNLGCRLTAEIHQETLEDMLRLLAQSTGVSYSIDKDNVTLSGRICQ